MRKILFLFLALSFLGLNAQKKKKTTKKKKAKTTQTTKTAADADAGNSADMANVDALVDAYAAPAEEPEEPINSMSILNAKSPSAFRKYREMNMIKVGDSVVSNKTTPLSYGFINDKDVLKSMVVWEIIDLNDKINQPIYHNTDGLVTSNKSLYQILFDAIMAGKIKQVYDDELFTTRIAPDAISSRVQYTTMSDAGKDKEAELGRPMTPEEAAPYIDKYEVKTENVKLIKVKGMWYVDRRDGQMKYRLLGIAAMGKDPTSMAQFGPDGQPLFQDEFIDLFWIYYPDAREVLANNIVFNNKNQSSDITFDDILNARRFSSIIYKSDSGLGNGVIQDYIPNDADAQLEESDRIKAQILQMENDMWNY